MNRVYQDDFTFTTGNCFSACLASLLELPLSAVPKFMAEEDWFGAVNRWLAPRNLRFIDVPWDCGLAICPDERGYCLLTGPSPRRPDKLHTVICVTERLRDAGRIEYRFVHDPHPDGGYLTGEPASVGFLVVLDPARLVQRGAP